MPDNHPSLREYARSGSEAAFREVVERYVNLVYSTALRLVNGDTHLAEDVTQSVFVDLAKMAHGLSGDVMLGGWLHRHTCFLANKTMRAERRRLNRERQSVEMNSSEDHAQANLAAISPVLDEAINQLGSEDRKAILLRYYEQRDFRGVGEALGSNEEAARKRVGRALDKLQVLLKRRGIALSATAIGTALGTGAVSAAPAGLAATISASVVVSAAAGGGTALTILHLMNITKAQVAVVSAIVVTLGLPLAVQRQAKAKLESENAVLRQVAAQVDSLSAENQRLSNLLARSSQAATPATNDQFRELMKLRGEVGQLRQTANQALAEVAAKTNPPSVMSGLTKSPEMTKMIRDQQKMGMAMIYQGLAKRANLSPETTEQLNETLADYVMTNIHHITTALTEGKSFAEVDKVLAAEEARLQEVVKGVIGPENADLFKEYNRNIASYLTAEQFASTLSGDKQVKEPIGKQLYTLMQEETERALAANGLPRDYQTVPSLNFRNFFSEEVAEKNLQLLDSIYEGVSARATFLTPEQAEKFADFRKLALNNNRLALTVNRKLMAPPNK